MSGYQLAGLYYAHWIGRWISPDPIGLKAGTNVYRYVRDNPIRLNDPSGTQEKPPDPNKLVIGLPETFQINFTGGGSTGSAQFLTIAPHGEQGRAIRDLSTYARLSESEHIWPRYFIAEQLRDPATGATPYNTAAYDASPTLLWTRGEAVAKTYGAGGDDPFIRQIRQALKSGTPPSPPTLQGASFEAAVQRSLAAASGPTGEAHVLVAAHGQLGAVHEAGKAQPIPSALQGITDAEIANALNALAEKPPAAPPPPPPAPPPPPPPPPPPKPAGGLPRPPRVNVGQIGANLPKAFKVIGAATTLLGAVNTAAKVEANVASGPGGLNKTAGAMLGLAGGIAAGAVDDALAVGLGIEGSPVIFEHWAQHGAGPTQTLVGEALIEFDYQFNRAIAAVTSWFKSP